jgi:hypothetical protein
MDSRQRNVPGGSGTSKLLAMARETEKPATTHGSVWFHSGAMCGMNWSSDTNWALKRDKPAAACCGA